MTDVLPFCIAQSRPLLLGGMLALQEAYQCHWVCPKELLGKLSPTAGCTCDARRMPMASHRGDTAMISEIFFYFAIFINETLRQRQRQFLNLTTLFSNSSYGV
jgi:hypothetical protein